MNGMELSREDASVLDPTTLVGRLLRRADTVTVNVETRDYDIVREKVRACLLCPIILSLYLYIMTQRLYKWGV